jgi:putative tryptophan/tyrosine transport system substrate-binding protein
MKKNILWIGIYASLSVFSSSVDAQQPKLPRIGYVSTNYASSPGPLVEAFGEGLRELGYINGKNIVVEYRYAEGKDDRIPSLVRELLRLDVGVLILPTLGAVRAAKQETRSIPIVMVVSEDPVATGLVDSLARPGGNITGLTRLQRQLSGKRLELLKEAIPSLSRVGILRDADSQSAAVGFQEYEAAARALKIQLQSLEVRSPNPDFDSVFQVAANAHADGLIIITTTLLFRRQKEIGDLAKKKSASFYVRRKYLG